MTAVGFARSILIRLRGQPQRLATFQAKREGSGKSSARLDGRKYLH